jgi:uncharacterized protein YbcI
VEGHPEQSSPAAAISRGAVQLLREYTGRGPTKARTTINHDSVMIVLGDTLTRASASWPRRVGRIESSTCATTFRW